MFQVSISWYTKSNLQAWMKKQIYFQNLFVVYSMSHIWLIDFTKYSRVKRFIEEALKDMEVEHTFLVSVIKSRASKRKNSCFHLSKTTGFWKMYIFPIISHLFKRKCLPRLLACSAALFNQIPRGCPRHIKILHLDRSKNTVSRIENSIYLYASIRFNPFTSNRPFHL